MFFCWAGREGQGGWITFALEVYRYRVRSHQQHWWRLQLMQRNRARGAQRVVPLSLLPALLLTSSIEGRGAMSLATATTVPPPFLDHSPKPWPKSLESLLNCLLPALSAVSHHFFFTSPTSRTTIHFKPSQTIWLLPTSLDQSQWLPETRDWFAFAPFLIVKPLLECLPICRLHLLFDLLRCHPTDVLRLLLSSV